MRGFSTRSKCRCAPTTHESAVQPIAWTAITAFPSPSATPTTGWSDPGRIHRIKGIRTRFGATGCGRRLLIRPWDSDIPGFQAVGSTQVPIWANPPPEPAPARPGSGEVRAGTQQNAPARFFTLCKPAVPWQEAPQSALFADFLQVGSTFFGWTRFQASFSHSPVLRYLVPESGIKTTMFLP